MIRQIIIHIQHKRENHTRMKTNSTARVAVKESKGLSTIACGQIASALKFYTPVSAVFLISRGLNYSEIFTLESVLLFSILLVEIPSGVWSDKVDRKVPIVLGFALSAVSNIIYALGQGFAWYAMSYCISGFSIALLSGILEAYVYESLGKDADKLATGVFGFYGSLELIGGVLASLCGSYLAHLNIAFPAYATAIASFIGFLLMVRLPSIPVSEREHGTIKSSFLKDLTRGARVLISTPVLAFVSITSSASFVLFNAVYTLNQPLYEQTNLPMSYWGLLSSVALILAAIYSYFSDKIESYLGRSKALFLAFIIGAAGFALMAVPSSIVVAIGFLLAVVGMNGRGPITSAVANSLIPSDYRSTVLNIASSLGSLIGMACNPIIGWGVDRNVATTTVGIAGILILIALMWLPIANKYMTDV